MNERPETDPRIAAWLGDGPTDLPERVLDAALREAGGVAQSGGGIPWRSLIVAPSRTGIVWLAAAVLAAVVGAAIVSPRPGPFAGPAGAGSREPSPLPSTTYDLRVSFTSPTYGYSIRLPAGWSHPAAPSGPGVDDFIGDQRAGINARSDPLPAGTSERDYLEQFRARLVASFANPECIGSSIDAWERIPIGTVSGYLIGCYDAISSSEIFIALAIDGGRLYDFGTDGYHDLGPSGRIDKGEFLAILASADLTPATATAQGPPAASASSTGPSDASPSP